jgi:hypothetical protein
MSEHEAQLSTKEWWPAAVWTAKEALYKLFGRRGVELRDDLKIVAYNADNKQISAQLPDNIMAIVDIELYDESIIVATAYFN